MLPVNDKLLEKLGVICKVFWYVE